MTQSHLPQDSFSSTPAQIARLGSLAVAEEIVYNGKALKLQDFHKATLLIDVVLGSGNVDTLSLAWEASINGTFGENEDIWPLRFLDPTSSTLSLITGLDSINASGRYVIPIPFDLVVPYIRLKATGTASGSNGYTVTTNVVLQKMYR